MTAVVPAVITGPPAPVTPAWTPTLSALIHGEPGVGKTTLLSTAPGRKLALDAEGSTRFLKLPKVYWDPLGAAPPEPGTASVNHPDREWELCVAYARDFRTVGVVDQWLTSGQHPFNAVWMDTLGEIQKRLVDQTSGGAQTTSPQWGEILRTMEDMIRRWRDFTYIDSNPLNIVGVACHTEYKNDRWRAMVKGQLELTLPGFFDVVGYLYTELTPEDPTHPARRLRIEGVSQWVAKDRTGSLTNHYGIIVPNPNLGEMLQVIAADQVTL